MRESKWALRMSIPLWFSSAILATILLLGMLVGETVRNLIPYGVAVGLVAWRHGTASGFMFAGLATAVAWASGAFPSRLWWQEHEIEEGFYTFLKLSAVVIGIRLTKVTGG